MDKIITFLVALLILTILFPADCGLSVGHGQQAGIISEVERNGII